MPASAYTESILNQMKKAGMPRTTTTETTPASSPLDMGTLALLVMGMLAKNNQTAEKLGNTAFTPNLTPPVSSLPSGIPGEGPTFPLQDLAPSIADFGAGAPEWTPGPAGVPAASPAAALPLPTRSPAPASQPIITINNGPQPNVSASPAPAPPGSPSYGALTPMDILRRIASGAIVNPGFSSIW